MPRDNRRSASAAHEVSVGAEAGVWQGDLSSVLGGGRNRLRAQLEEARREMGQVGPVRQNAAAAAASSSGDNGSWMLPAAAAARDAQQHRHQQAQRTGASATAPFADSMFWPEGQEMSYDALLALDRAAIQKGVPKVTNHVFMLSYCVASHELTLFSSVNAGPYQEKEGCRR